MAKQEKPAPGDEELTKDETLPPTIDPPPPPINPEETLSNPHAGPSPEDHRVGSVKFADASLAQQFRGAQLLVVRGPANAQAGIDSGVVCDFDSEGKALVPRPFVDRFSDPKRFAVVGEAKA